MKTKYCCKYFEKMKNKFDWMQISNTNILVMPHFDISEEKIRINYCPSCGEEISDIELEIEIKNKDKD